MPHRRSLCLRFVFFLASLALAATAGAQAFDPAALDAEIAAMMAAWEQPGVAVAVVKDGRIVHERGFGVRSLDTRAPVDEHTLFGIASVSKSFASATVARLVADGRLHWDDLVTRHLPWFRLPRDRDTDEVTLRDLLSMRTGIGSSEYTFRRVSANRADHVRRLRYLAQMHPLRSEYLYTTDAYTAIGQVVTEVAGQAWEEYAAAVFWRPLGMSRTNADHLVARADANAASPHLTVGRRKQPIPWVYEDYNALPAGGINSTAHDLALWLRFQLAGGEVDGRRLLPADVLRETRTPQTPVRGRFAGNDWADAAGDGPEAIRANSYAMGWSVHEYRGYQVVTHSGGIDGFRCRIGFLPGAGIGVVVLGNTEDSLFPTAVFQTAVDHLIGLGPGRPWSERLLARTREQQARREAAAAALAAARIPNTRPSLPLAAYAGVFADAGAFGEARVTVEGDRLALAAGRLVYDLEHWHHDVFKARPRWPYEMESRNFFVTFDLGERARADSFRFSTGYTFNRLR